MLQPVPTHCYTTEEIIKLEKERENNKDYKGTKVLLCEGQVTGTGIFILERTVFSGDQSILVK